MWKKRKPKVIRSKFRPEINTERYKKWRVKVFLRDRFKCILCGSRRKLNAHHLDGWSWAITQRYNTSNGVTLCSYHHHAFHKTCGTKVTRSMFNRFIQEKYNKKLSDLI